MLCLRQQNYNFLLTEIPSEDQTQPLYQQLKDFTKHQAQKKNGKRALTFEPRLVKIYSFIRSLHLTVVQQFSIQLLYRQIRCVSRLVVDVGVPF